MKMSLSCPIDYHCMSYIIQDVFNIVKCVYYTSLKDFGASLLVDFSTTNNSSVTSSKLATRTIIPITNKPINKWGI